MELLLSMCLANSRDTIAIRPTTNQVLFPQNTQGSTSRHRCHEWSLIRFADYLCYIATGHRSRGQTTPRLNPLSGHIEVIQPGEGLTHTPRKILGFGQPPLIATPPVTCITLPSDGGSDIAHLHLSS